MATTQLIVPPAERLAVLNAVDFVATNGQRPLYEVPDLTPTTEQRAGVACGTSITRLLGTRQARPALNALVSDGLLDHHPGRYYYAPKDNRAVGVFALNPTGEGYRRGIEAAHDVNGEDIERRRVPGWLVYHRVEVNAGLPVKRYYFDVFSSPTPGTWLMTADPFTAVARAVARDHIIYPCPCGAEIPHHKTKASVSTYCPRCGWWSAWKLATDKDRPVTLKIGV
jgi:hypothetical protein